MAIAIPVLNNSLEKSRQAADAANIRGAYAQAITNMMVDNSPAGWAVTQATMKTNKFDELNEGDTLAGVSLTGSINKAHLVGSYVKVVVDVTSVNFIACTDAKGTDLVPGASYSVSVNNGGSGTGT